MKMKKIQPLAPDKYRGKPVKFKSGDCLVICYPDGNYLAALISEKFNAYYDLTLLEYFNPKKPTMDDFYNGRIFGTRFGSLEELSYAVDKRMIKCSVIDNANNIFKIGNLPLIENLQKAAYSYLDNEIELLEYYIDELPVRIEKTINAEKFPDLGFVSKHLIDMRNIVKK
jgi:hypothetical protein